MVLCASLLTGCTADYGTPAMETEPEEESAPPTATPEGYAVYTNDRFSFSLNYPDSLLRPQSEPQNGDGQLFVSADSSVVLAAFGRHLVLQDSIPLLFARRLEARREEDGIIMYSARLDSSFVISGTADDRMYHERSVFYDGTMARIELSYPFRMQPALDSVVAEVSGSLRGSL